MLSIIFFIIVILLLTYLYSYKKAERALLIGFVLHFLFFSIRTRYGNDYSNYVDIYNMFAPLSITDIFDEHYIHFEIGWRLLCFSLGNFGFQSVVIAVQALTSISVYYFIKECVPRNLALFAVTIYVLTPDYMLVPLSMLREGVSISFCILGIVLIIKKRVLLSIVFAILAVLFHRTAIVFFIIYPFLLFESYFRKRLNIIVVFFMFILFFVARNIVNEYSELLFASDAFSRYEGYLDRTDGLTFGIGNIVEFAMFGLPAFIYYNNCKVYKELTACQIYLLSYLFFPLATLTVLLQRLVIYFGITSIVVIPLVYSKMSNKFRFIYLIGIMLFSIYRFISFFYSPIYGKYFMEYNTIFD